MNEFLPVSKQDMIERGWDHYDFLFVSGDAYVDHPSFGLAIISRALEKQGFRVVILAQPDWTTTSDFLSLGRPRLGVLLSSGNLDSMVNHYTVSKKPRSNDSYSENAESDKRPDRAVIVYANRIRESFGDIPIIIGGVEASLRRFAHYDYWQNSVRRSVLIDSRANILVYGMGERAIVEIANRLKSGTQIKDITDIAGTAYVTSDISGLTDKYFITPSFEDVRDNKEKYAEAHKRQHEEQDPIRGRIVVQPHHDRFLVQNPPAMPLTRNELDAVYSLPYARTYHPMYTGGIPAIEEVKFSITSCRGCFGACNFCALTFHQGRIVTSRSKESILTEAKSMTYDPEFKGYIHDVGGPTANFRKPACKIQLKRGACKDKRCLSPTPCKELEIDHSEYLDLLSDLRGLDNVKKVFIRSGIRFDYVLKDKDERFLNELCEHHISGQLKVAPEHVSDNVLSVMGKPPIQVFDQFKKKFYEVNDRLGKKQYLVPYLMSSHPGSTIADAISLAVYLKKNNIKPEQVQDFYPTPGTTSTCIFYTGMDPFTKRAVYVPKDPKEKAMQRALMQYFLKDNYALVHEALIKSGREDLIGKGEHCLIWPKLNNTKERVKNDDFRRKKGIATDQGRVKARGYKPKAKRD